MKNNTEQMIKEASSRMHMAYIAYLTWKWLEQARNENKSGRDEALRHVEIMSKQPNFFHTAVRGSFYIFIVDLCIFFDRQKPALSLDKIIDSLDLSKEEVEKIDTLRDSQKESILKLKNLRDKDVAHYDIDFERPERNILLFKEVEDVFLSVQKIFNILSNNFNNSVWSWKHLNSDVDHEMEFLFNTLEKGEKARIEEIHKKYNITFQKEK